jgi:hypothetical protein
MNTRKEVCNMYKDGALFRAIVDGIIAQRILDGEPGNYGPEDPEKLRAIVAQGKRIEERCRNEGRLDIIERANEHTRR